MSLTNCPTCGETWKTHGAACKTKRLGSFAAPACYDADLKAALQMVKDARAILERGRGLRVPLDAAGHFAAAWHALDEVEHALREAS